jgi:hypothetical protein
MPDIQFIPTCNEYGHVVHCVQEQGVRQDQGAGGRTVRAPQARDTKAAE